MFYHCKWFQRTFRINVQSAGTVCSHREVQNSMAPSALRPSLMHDHLLVVNHLEWINSCHGIRESINLNCNENRNDIYSYLKQCYTFVCLILTQIRISTGAGCCIQFLYLLQLNHFIHYCIEEKNLKILFHWNIWNNKMNIGTQPIHNDIYEYKKQKLWFEREPFVYLQTIVHRTLILTIVWNRR